MSTVTEIATAAEQVTAVIDLTYPAMGDRLCGPMLIGHYCDEHASPANREVWIEQEGKRVQFLLSDMPTVIKQLRRTERIMKEQA